MIKIVSKEVEFAPGSVLTGDMLKEMYSFPKWIYDLQYARYGGGIISGMELRQDGDTVIIGSGIIKLYGKLFYSEHEIDIGSLKLEQKINGGNFYIGLRKEETTNEPGIKVYSLSIQSYEVANKKDTDMILMRLNRDNAGRRILPNVILEDEKPFDEFFENSRCGLLETPFSCYEGVTFIPYVCQSVRSYLEAKPRCDSSDLALLIHLQNNPVVSVSSIRKYIRSKDMDDVLDDSIGENLFADWIKAIEKTQHKIITNYQDKINDKNLSNNDEDDNYVLKMF